MSFHRTNFKCQDTFDILRLVSSNGFEHMKKGSGTVPITINGNHMVRVSLTSVEAWPPLSPHMLLLMVCDFSPLIWGNLIFCPLHKEMSGWMTRALMLNASPSHIVLAVKLIFLSPIAPMKGKTQYSLLHTHLWKYEF